MTTLALSNAPINDPSGVLPVVSFVDSVLRPGTLAIFDPAHSLSPLSAVPANGDLLPNVVPTAQLNTLLGQSNVANDYKLVSQVTGLSASVGLLELTPKKALNATFTRTNQVAFARATVGLPDKLRQYILDHLSHQFLFVVERELTFAAGTSGIAAGARIPAFVSQSTSSVLSNYHGFQSDTGFTPSSGGNFVGGVVSGAGHAATGKAFLALAVGGFTGTVPSLANFTVCAGFGSPPGYQSSPWYNKLSSGALYRFVVEDLTASGISFDRAVNGIGQRDSHLEQYSRDFAVGGRWYGDTLRNPSTLP